MWIWWIISLIVLVACFIFAYKVIMSSYDWLPADKNNFMSFKKASSSGNTFPRSEAIYDLKNKLQKVEENSSFYEIQFSKLQERLNHLESQYETQLQTTLSKKSQEEDWKEMYYEENELKEKLENELDLAQQRLEEMQKQLAETEENDSKWKAFKSDYDARLNDLESMQNNIEILQRQLEASVVREKELQLSLASEINAKKQFSNLESVNARLRSENDDLRSQLVQIHNREKELEFKISKLNELESRVAIYEEEKAKMIASLEVMVNANKATLNTNKS
jgi:chromosome segregation ATPase